MVLKGLGFRGFQMQEGAYGFKGLGFWGLKLKVYS